MLYKVVAVFSKIRHFYQNLTIVDVDFCTEF